MEKSSEYHISAHLPCERQYWERQGAVFSPSNSERCFRGEWRETEALLVHKVVSIGYLEFQAANVFQMSTFDYLYKS